MAIHYTCDGCGDPVDGTNKDQDKALGRVAVHRGPLVVASLNDLCAVCTESMCAAIRKLSDRRLPGRG